MLRLKKMALSDISTVAALFLDGSQMRFWEDGAAHDRESAAELLSGYFRLPSHHWMMTWAADLAGYGHILRSDFLESWIVSYIVAPEFQGKGIATAFVEEAKTFASDEGIESLYASVHPANLASIRVVEKSGFQLADSPTNSKQNLYRWPPHSKA